MKDVSFANRTMVMSGGSRGIGLAIALAIGRRGGNVVLLAKTDKPNPKLPGTIHTAVDEIIEAGGKAVAVVGDVRDDDAVARVAATAIDSFGGIDIVVNNASVLNLAKTVDLPLAKYDLMQSVNVRGTFSLTRACLPYLVDSENPHVLTLSPPLNMAQEWLGKHPGYMLAKYGMTLAALGFAAEYADALVSSNCLWPESTIATAAVENLLGGKEGVLHSRSPDVMADAAVEVLSRGKGELTGQTLIDVDVLRQAGLVDLSRYGGAEPIAYDIFVDPR